MNILSSPVVAMAGISLYVGLYHLWIYIRRPKHRVDLAFAFLCFSTVVYDAFCIGLYNSTSVIEGAQWQRAQLISLALFVPAFLWFVLAYTHRKPGIVVRAFSIYYLLAVIVQLVDRSSLTWLMDQPSVKHIGLPFGLSITYYEVTFGLFTTIQSLVGIVASTYLLAIAIHHFRNGNKKQATPLILGLGLMYGAAIHDTMVGNGLYHSIYLMEYAFLGIIIVMAYSLSNTIVDAALAKDALKKSEEWFRSLIETTSDWVWEVNANGVYTYASPKVCDLLGYEPKEVVGHTPFDFMPAEEAGRVSVLFGDSVRDQKPIEIVENICQSKDGRLVVLETSGVPFFDEDGNLAGYHGIDRDITERKRTERMLQLFQHTVDHALEAIYWMNDEARFEYVNDYACRSLGYTREEMMGLSLWDIDSVYPRERWHQSWGRGQEYKHGDVNNVESLHRRKDGSVFPVEVTSTPIWFGGKELHVAVVRDITERKRAEEALQESEERYRRLVEVSPIPMWINQDGVIAYINPIALQTLGADRPDQIVGRDVLDFVHPLYHDIVKDRISQMVNEGKTIPLMEEKFVKLDGEVIDVEVIATPFATSGGRAMQVLFQDITKRKINEAEREALILDLETRNAELERFTYTISHDLKSPLVTITGFLGYLERDAKEGNMERLRDDIKRIQEAANRMRRLLNELLELSRIGRLVNPPEVIPFANLVREALDVVHGQLEEGDITITIQSDLPAVFGDHQRLVEVLQNLIDNAAKFMGDQPKPRIEIGRQCVDAVHDKVIFFVRDNGVGIESKYHEQVFGLFNKLNPDVDGTGIGLALVKRIIEVHGGRIWLESDGAGKGTTFYFTLPIAKQE